MSNTNYVQVLLTYMVLFMVIMSGAINCFEKYLAVFISHSIRYGKFASTKKSSFTIDVPKEWFKHFYLYASVLSIIAVYLCVRVFIFLSPSPQWINDFLDTCAGTTRPTANASRTLLATTLFTLHCMRRAYETQYVSVYAKTSKINLLHYLLGFIHYTLCVLTLLIGAPLFSQPSRQEIRLHWTDLNILDAFAVTLLIWASYQQHQAAITLANIRKDNRGAVVNHEHKLPNGGWFEYVTNPHMLAEVLIYTALAILLCENTTWRFVWAWVFSNQVELALLSHWWYQDKFEHLPKHRKALIPFIL